MRAQCSPKSRSDPGPPPRLLESATRSPRVHQIDGRRSAWGLRALLCSGLLALGLWFAGPTDLQWSHMLPLHRAGWMGVMVVVAVLGYCAALFICGLRLKNLRNQGAIL